MSLDGVHFLVPELVPGPVLGGALRMLALPPGVARADETGIRLGGPLTVNTDGTTTFNGTVGVGGGLSALTIDLNAGASTIEKTVIGANISTQGTITFNDPVSR